MTIRGAKVANATWSVVKACLNAHIVPEEPEVTVKLTQEVVTELYNTLMYVFEAIFSEDPDIREPYVPAPQSPVDEDPEDRPKDAARGTDGSDI